MLLSNSYRKINNWLLSKKYSGNSGFKSTIHSTQILASLCSIRGDLCIFSFCRHFTLFSGHLYTIHNWTMMIPFNTLTKYHLNLPKHATHYSVEMLNKRMLYNTLLLPYLGDFNSVQLSLTEETTKICALRKKPFPLI